MALGTTIFLVGQDASADELGHFAGGLVNIREYVMPPEPGVYTSIYNYYCTNAALNFHYFHEFASDDRFQGDVFGLNLAYRW